MKRLTLILGVVILLVAAAIAPMWVTTAGMGLGGHGYAAVFLTIFLLFLVGGGLMFLVFYSARRGYDEKAHGASPRDERDG